MEIPLWEKSKISGLDEKSNVLSLAFKE